MPAEPWGRRSRHNAASAVPRRRLDKDDFKRFIAYALGLIGEVSHGCNSPAMTAIC